MPSKPTNFSWIYYISRAKLNLSEKETGRLTYKEFKLRYKAYKDVFDMELLLTLARKTYAQVDAEANKSEEWFS